MARSSHRLGRYLPALRYAVRLAREREAELSERLEPHGHQEAQRARRRLEELRRRVKDA